MSNSTQNETHNVCNERLAREGGQARCCDCEPHEGCTLGDHIVPSDKKVDTQNGIATFGESNSGVTARIIYELVTSGRFSKEDSIKIIEANIADARKEELDTVEKLLCTHNYSSMKSKETFNVKEEIRGVLATLKEEAV